MVDLERIRHSSAHVLAAAVKKLWPDTKLGIGPVIEDGFYYDIDTKHVFTPEDFPKIEKEMEAIIKKDEKFERKVLTQSEAKKLFKLDPYKSELIEDIQRKGEEISIYQTGEFVDLCHGPHVSSTKEIGAFKLLKIAGAYWKGDAKNSQMQRIYGTAFASKKELEEYLHRLEEAKKRDHRILGEQLDLVMIHEYSPGSPFFLPKGTIIYLELMKFIREEYQKRGFKEVITPLLFNKKLWETSGHWEHYKDNMFNIEIEKETFSFKPMNCPSHCLIYKRKLWSYRELPLRIADFAALHRNELSGTLSGLTRVRKMSQDDAHIFVTKDQLEEEIKEILDFEKFVYEKIFKFEYHMYLGTRPDNFLGEKEVWDKAEKILEDVLKEKKITYTLMPKDGAFYGPKIDLRVKDALGREWQLATVQLDFQMPLRFDLSYEGADGKKHNPIMIHRAVLGTLERFIGVLIEHFAGKFPVWLSPVQVSLITVADRHIPFANELKKEFESQGLRVEVDARTESIGKKVRDNQAEKIPYVVTIGDKEMESGNLAVRDRNNQVNILKKEVFLEQVKKEVAQRQC